MKQRKRRLQDVSEEFRQRYRWRAGVEATMSRFKHQMGMARFRVRGMAKITYAAMLRAGTQYLPCGHLSNGNHESLSKLEETVSPTPNDALAKSHAQLATTISSGPNAGPR